MHVKIQMRNMSILTKICFPGCHFQYSLVISRHCKVCAHFFCQFRFCHSLSHRCHSTPPFWSWLAASTTKIETQVQSLQRRCTQYGLTLIAAPQLSVSRSVFLNPFRTPLLFSVRDRFKVPTLYTTLAAKDYIHDGVFPTEASTIAECIEDGSDFKFRRYGKLPHARQFLHRSGTLFVRIVVDRQGWALIVVFANSRHIARDKSLHQNCCSVLRELRDLVESLQ